ncbi:MAG: hypothetical protein KDK70_30705 [Myxococcales bacterium]|nr:hypothetical protein [Myxococcales bacterium]
MIARRPLLPLASLLIVVAACAMDLPISERIVDVRPLAVRVEASSLFGPEPEGAAVRAEALPVDDLRVIPFLVDDQAPLSPERIEAEIEPVWLACPLQPIQGVFSCLSAKLPLELAQIEDCPPIDFSALDPSSLELPEMPAPCRLTGGTPAEPQMQVPLDFNFLLGGDLELTMIGHRPGSGTTERCTQAVLEQEPLPSECLVLVQRASIGPDAAILRLAADAGLPVEQLGPVPDEDEVPDADRHPRIQTFRVVVTDEQVRRDDLQRILDEGEAIEVARGDTITAARGQTLVIETTAPAEDLQTYLIPANDDRFEEREEYYVGDWYRSWGTLLSNDSDDPVSYNTWRMVPGEQDDPLTETPPEGQATLYYVLRDDRQGVDWWWFHVQVQ